MKVGKHITGQQLLPLLFIWLLVYSCRQKDNAVPSTYVYKAPVYDIAINTSPDTLHFYLGDDTFNDIKSINYFDYKGKSYIALYDRRSESVNIYDFHTQQRVKRILLKPTFKGKALVKGSVYVKSFDSLFVTNKYVLYLVNGNGQALRRIEFENGVENMAIMDNTTPAVLKDNMLYTGVRPYANESSLSALRKWKLLYRFNISSQDHQLDYSLPAIYHDNFWGKRFLEYGYCYNDKGRFVFSFPADTAIYETDLSAYHAGYYAKSKFQSGNIEPVYKEQLKEEATKQFAIRDSYGPIFFDPYRKRYLRLANQKMSPADYETKKERRKSIIIFDEDFRIIGESPIDKGCSFKSLFFTADGKIYAKVNVKDEYAIHFVRLAYTGEEKETIQLTDNKTGQ